MAVQTRCVALLLIAPLAAACGASEESGPSQEEMSAMAHADSIQIAAEAYDPAAFDTISWESVEDQHARGGLVFSVSCSKCHGSAGAGDGNFVQRGDTLRPPSFLAADWRFAEDMAGLRRQIFTGTPNGMPHWGLLGLKYRDVDAVSAYITNVLRSQ